MGTSTKMSYEYFGEVSYGHFGTKEDTLALGNTGPSHGNGGWLC